jgi:hypothetical protein
VDADSWLTLRAEPVAAVAAAAATSAANEATRMRLLKRGTTRRPG